MHLRNDDHVTSVNRLLFAGVGARAILPGTAFFIHSWHVEPSFYPRIDPPPRGSTRAVNCVILSPPEAERAVCKYEWGMFFSKIWGRAVMTATKW